jgi:hypothetical protein
MTTYRAWNSGIGNVGSYQASSIPYTTSSLAVAGSPSSDVVKISFPHVTRFVTIKNIGVEGATDCLLRVGFSEKGIANGNYFLLNNEESYSADWRVSALYLRVDNTSSAMNATASVIAGLTDIDPRDLEMNWSGSIGVG